MLKLIKIFIYLLEKHGFVICHNYQKIIAKISKKKFEDYSYFYLASNFLAYF